NNRDRNLVVSYLEVSGPFGVKHDLSEFQKRYLSAAPAPAAREAAARRVLAALAQRAYRRPVASEEVDRLMRVYYLALKQGEPFERGVQLGVEAILVSPNFLFRVERDPHPNDPKASRDVNDYELAS